ncbi:hypothetical protein PIB30_042024 [Stylosanthes scabra]|uniref:Uncharacterized protein n=1 Tax=Stylosanthes scabra TaxID=79078 RepID=A0ABU6UEC1_9FABA|nr:hypothetical protein [Stylosanthes scabra]
MRDILVLRPTKHSRHLLPYPVFISRIAARHELPEFPNDKFYTIRPVDTYVPYAEQLPQPETSAAPSASAQPAMDRSCQQIMRHLEKQERLLRQQHRQITNTQLMIRQAFPDTVFEGLVSDDSGGSTEAEF